MKIERIKHDPRTALEFFSQGLESLGAVCEAPWYDRLEVVAEGAAAKLWDGEGGIVHRELRFPEVGADVPKEVTRDVFPGCPILFQLAETLRADTSAMFKVVIGDPAFEEGAPRKEVLEKTWTLARPRTGRPRFSQPVATRRFSFVFVVRLEVQSTDQHWSLHRVACGWPDGARDAELERDLFMQAVGKPAPGESLDWPSPTGKELAGLLERVLPEMEPGLGAILDRQRRYMARELSRIDEYFSKRVAELNHRRQRSTAKIDERIAATKNEHRRRREDQVNRHEVVVTPHVDGVACVAERSWSVNVTGLHGREETDHGRWHFVPRTRRWFPPPGA